MQYFEVSALTGMHVDECFMDLAKKVNGMKGLLSSQMMLGGDNQVKLTTEEEEGTEGQEITG